MQDLIVIGLGMGFWSVGVIPVTSVEDSRRQEL